MAIRFKSTTMKIDANVRKLSKMARKDPSKLDLRNSIVRIQNKFEAETLTVVENSTDDENKRLAKIAKRTKNSRSRARLFKRITKRRIKLLDDFYGKIKPGFSFSGHTLTTGKKQYHREIVLPRDKDTLPQDISDARVSLQWK